MTSATTSPPVPAAPSENVPDCPYVGLVPFTEEYEAYFFGRERYSNLIVANLTATRLTVLYAASGVGKSSVLRAGVMPNARRLAAETWEDFGVPGPATVYFSNWSEAPLDGIAQAVLDAIAIVPGTRPVRASEPARLSVDWLRGVIWQSGVGAVHLILDQFEEYFLYHAADDGSREGLVAALGAILSERALWVNVILSIREDALASLDRFKGQIPHLFDNYLRLPPLDRRAAREAIENPLERYNQLVAVEDRVTIEPDLVDILLDQVPLGLDLTPELHGGAAAELAHTTGSAPADLDQIEAPFLQLVLARLWAEERAAGSPVLRTETLERLGGAATIVRTHLDKVMAGLRPDQLEIAAAIFRHLVTSSGTKIALTAAELADQADLPQEPVRDLLKSLSDVEFSILRTVPPPVGKPGPTRYEIFHDVMGAAVLLWRRQYVAEREQIRAQQRLVEEREEADAAANQARRRLRRTRLIAAAMAVVLVVVAGLGVVAVLARRAADEATREANQQELVAQATALLEKHPAQSLATALAAHDVDPMDPAAREAVLKAATAPRSTIIAGPTPNAPDEPDAVHMVVTSNARHVVIFDDEGGIRVVSEFGDERQASVPNLVGRVVDAAVTPDASLVALSTDKGEVRVIDMKVNQVTDWPTEYLWAPPIALAEPAEGARLLVTDTPTAIRGATDGVHVNTLRNSLDAVTTTDRSHFVTSDLDDEQSRLRVWNSATGELVIESDPRTATDVVTFLLAYEDAVVGILRDFEGVYSLVRWDWKLGPTPVVYPIDSPNEILAAELDPDSGEVLLAADKYAFAVDLEDAATTLSLPNQPDELNDLSALAGGRWIATAGGDGRVLVWSGRDLRPNQPTFELLGHRGAVLRVAMLSATSVVSLGLDGNVRRWELPWVVRHDAHTDRVRGLDTSANGLIASASFDGTASIMTADMTVLATIETAYTYRARVKQVRFDPSNSHRIATLEADALAPVLWWWSEEGDSGVQRSFEQIDADGLERLTSIDISADGEYLAASGSQGTIYLWRMATGKLRHGFQIERGTATDVAFDPLNELVAATGPAGARLWTLLGSDVIDLAAPNATSVVFDRTGNQIAVTTEGGTIYTFSRTGKLIRELEFSASGLGRPAFDKAGRLLVVGSAEGIIEVKELESGRTILLSRVHGDSVNDVAFLTEDASRIVSASDDTVLALSRCVACTDPAETIRDAREWIADNPPLELVK